MCPRLVRCCVPRNILVFAVLPQPPDLVSIARRQNDPADDEPPVGDAVFAHLAKQRNAPASLRCTHIQSMSSSVSIGGFRYPFGQCSGTLFLIRLRIVLGARPKRSESSLTSLEYWCGISIRQQCSGFKHAHQIGLSLLYQPHIPRTEIVVELEIITTGLDQVRPP